MPATGGPESRDRRSRSGETERIWAVRSADTSMMRQRLPGPGKVSLSGSSAGMASRSSGPQVSRSDPDRSRTSPSRMKARTGFW